MDEQAYQIWLLSRRIRKKLDTPSECYDYEVFQSIGTPLTEDIVSIDRYYQCYNNQGSDLLPHIEPYLAKKVSEIEADNELTDSQDEFIANVKRDRDTREPVWSNWKSHQPADNLLPSDMKLCVNFTVRKYVSRKSVEGFGFKNNLMQIFGDYIIIGRSSTVEIHNRACLTAASKLFYLKLSDWSAHIDETTMTEQLKIPDAFISTNLMDVTINYMKILEIKGGFYLCLCCDSGIVLFYSLATIVMFIEDNKHGTSRIEIAPYMVLRTPVSCWSADSIDYDGRTYIALGHNGPGISLFVISYDEDNVVVGPVHCKEVITVHNVPCLSFIPGETNTDGSLLLVYASIFGNLTSLAIKFDQTNNDIDVSMKDTQFFGEFCWTVTPLTSADFMEVGAYEFLNLNYQKVSKVSTLSSMCQDSQILGNSPSNCYKTKSFGIGALTTQVKVPVSQLELSCRYGMVNLPVKLRFTTFDNEGFIQEARLLPNYISGIPPGGTIEFFLHNNTEVQYKVDVQSAQKEKVRFNYAFPALSSETLYEDIERRIEKVLDSTTLDNNLNSRQNDGFSQLFKVRQKSQIWGEKNGLKYQYNRNYLTTIYNSHDLEELSQPFSQVSNDYVVLCASSVFHSGYRGSWKDIAPYNINEITSTENEEIPEDHKFLHPSLSLASAQEGNQRKWGIHNHVKKVHDLLNCIEPNTRNYPMGYKLKEFHSGFLLVTTAQKVYLVKTHPMLILSYTSDEIFPLESITLCSFKGTIMALNRINFVCHIKEMNCIAVASQVGLISLLRLTKYKGIHSFRQEYILGWNTLGPENDDEFQCIYSKLHGSTNVYCGIDDIDFPFLEINGMDYIYCPRDDVKGVAEYAYLIVSFGSDIAKFKIDRTQV